MHMLRRVIFFLMNSFYTGEIDDELFLDVAVVRRAGHDAQHQLSLKGSQPRTFFSRGIRIKILDEYA